MSSDPVKVIYIAGEGRSGSTLLGRLLGEIEGAINVGELYFSLEDGFRDRALCGCGRRLRECEFWSAVFQCGFGGFDTLEVKTLLETKQALERVRTLPRLLAPLKTADETRRLGDYVQTLDTLYAAIRQVSGARVIVDGSKSVPYSYILAQASGVDLRLLHLVRDSRAVAFSNQRRKLDPSGYLETGYLKQEKPLRVAAAWNILNLLLMLKKPSRHYSLMRYEDAMRDPAGAVAALWRFLDEPPPRLDFLEASPLSLHPSHTVNGNPNRFQSEVVLRLDNEWQEKMPPSQRRLMTALTFPLLLHYGYLRSGPVTKDVKQIQPSSVL